jgi:hypothetical protein
MTLLFWFEEREKTKRKTANKNGDSKKNSGYDPKKKKKRAIGTIGTIGTIGK